MIVTTDGNISNQVKVAKMTTHIGFVKLYRQVLILMPLILKNYSANRIYKFVQGMCKFWKHHVKVNFSFSSLQRTIFQIATLIIDYVEPSGYGLAT